MQANITNMNNATFYYIGSQMAQGASDVTMVQETHNDRGQNLKWRARFRKIGLRAYFLNATQTVGHDLQAIDASHTCTKKSNSNTGGLMIIVRNGIDVLEDMAHVIDKYAHAILPA